MGRYVGISGSKANEEQTKTPYKSGKGSSNAEKWQDHGTSTRTPLDAIEPNLGQGDRADVGSGKAEMGDEFVLRQEGCDGQGWVEGEGGGAGLWEV